MLTSSLVALADGVSKQEINDFVNKLQYNQVSKEEAMAMRKRVMESKSSSKDEFEELLGDGASDDTFWFSIDGFFRGFFTGNVSTNTLTEYRISTYNASTKKTSMYTIKPNQSGKVVFCTPNGNPLPVSDSEVALIKQSLSTLYIIQDMCENTSNQYASSAYKKALLASEKIKEAIANNGGDVYDVMPMPKAGALHSQIHASALAAAKKVYGNVVDVVITENNWEYHRTQLDVIIDRYTTAQLIAVGSDGAKYGIKCFFMQKRNGGNYDPIFLEGVVRETKRKIKQ